jgi:DNA-binding NarL/FixJ family response regulator
MPSTDTTPSLHQRADDVLALKENGMGLKAIARELDMAVSSVHSVLAGRKSKR